MAIPNSATPLDSRLTAAAQGRRDNTPAQARKVAREFEAMMVGMMVKAMRDTVGKDKMTGGGRGEETFRPLLDQEYAAAAAQNGGIGLAKMIEQELTRNSGAASGPTKGSANAD